MGSQNACAFEFAIILGRNIKCSVIIVIIIIIIIIIIIVMPKCAKFTT